MVVIIHETMNNDCNIILHVQILAKIPSLKQEFHRTHTQYALSIVSGIPAALQMRASRTVITHQAI